MTEFKPDTWVQRTAAEYAQAIAGELPTGTAWSRDPDGDLIKWVEGCAEIWGDVSAAAALLLLVESDPSKTVGLLPDWEAALGLPDPCVPQILSLPERQVALVNKLTTQGGQSREFFIGVAAALGYTITIKEYSTFQVGLSSIGGPRGRIMAPSSRYCWTVKVAQPRITRFQIGRSSVGKDSLLEIIHAEDLECVIQRWKPAHTTVLFEYEIYGAVFDFFFNY